MIISKTPFRISFFGGGTDYPAWVKEHNGLVVGTSINKYSYISLRHLPQFFDYNYRLAYSKIEEVKTIAEIEHRAIKAVFTTYDVQSGLELSHIADLPARSGLGSSSSFIVGLINALEALRGFRYTKEALRTSATFLEQFTLQEKVGYQDQAFAAYGGLNSIEFLTNGGIRVLPVNIDTEFLHKLESSIILVFTGIQRIASKIAGCYTENMEEKYQRLRKIYKIAEKGLKAFENKDIYKIGDLLNESWLIKRSISPEISDSNIDTIYKQAISSGAIGGKLLGAGGGGFMMFLVPPDKQPSFYKEFQQYVLVPVKFDFDGSTILWQDKESDICRQVSPRF